MGEVWGAEVGVPTGCLHRARWELAVTPRTPVSVWTQKTTVDSGDQLQSLWVSTPWQGSPGPAPLLSSLPPGGQDKAKALSSLVSTCCLLLQPESLGGSPSPLRWGWGQPALTECLLYTAGPPPSPVLILRLPMKVLRRLMGGGDASDRPSWDGTRAGVTLALCSLPGACRRLLDSWKGTQSTRESPLPSSPLIPRAH